MSDFYQNAYNPDVLLCLANLSNDEVFTPPDIANDMLDQLPQSLFRNPNTKFLDPACKSGIFLREIAKRLIVGLSDKIPDLQDRIDHIFKNQLYGIAITELTSLLSRRSVYCSKYPNGPFSISKFEDIQGNIKFKRFEHTWEDGKCKFCGIAQSEYDRGIELETHAYEWIHTKDPEEVFNMKFDVIIGNPPYQLSDSGHGMSAKPIYQHFVQQSMKLQPRYLAMIIPARWYSGGKGLDDFRFEMLNNKHIRKLVDYGNSSDVFNGVDIAGGICYFLWDRDNEGPCEVINIDKESSVKSTRYLNEFDTFVRSSQALKIIHKVNRWNKKSGKYLSERVSSRKPFGLPTNYAPQKSGVPCWFIQRVGRQYASGSDVIDQKGLLDKWKLLVPKAPIAGQTDFSKPVGFYYDGNTRIAKPGECCTESWLVAGAFDTEEETLNYKSYIFTKTVRFLILQTVVSQDVTKKNYCFVPDLGEYTVAYTDETLREMWKITDDEWAYIDSKIYNIGGNK